MIGAVARFFQKGFGFLGIVGVVLMRIAEIGMIGVEESTRRPRRTVQQLDQPLAVDSVVDRLPDSFVLKRRIAGLAQNPRPVVRIGLEADLKTGGFERRDGIWRWHFYP